MSANNKPKNVNAIVERFDYRLVFSKKGRARFISHLDLMRTFSRIFKRAKIPVWYTQGFNPRLYIMFPLALPLGTESDVEIMDISLTKKLDENELMQRVNDVMPEGMHINKVYTPNMSHKDISASEYEIKLRFEGLDDPAGRFNEYLSQDKVIARKFSKKKGTVEIDIKNDIKPLEVKNEGDILYIRLILPSGNDKNINTSVVVDSFEEYIGIKHSMIYTTRTKIIAKNGENFT
ncbi:MAG: TIGR03936 family radical SAM-associated protein [Ruminococcus sp.]|nr:TIGR03936 family radical SAM-associated protein [Ruminococcus sp.]